MQKNLAMNLLDLQDKDFASIFAEKGLLAWVLVLITAAILIVVVRFVLKVVSRRLLKLARRTSFVGDNIIAGCLSETRLWFISLWISIPLILLVERSETVTHIARFILVIASCCQLIIWGLRGIQEWKNLVLLKKVEHNTSASAAFGLIYTALKGLLIVGIILMGLSNLGVNIGALITGLGIGGIAVALAAQNVLGDLFASLSIVLDKPFVVGDFIASGDELGSVENIGIKTTRVRSLSGEELVFSNKDLLDSRIRNYKRMWKRRVVLQFQVSYTTPLAKVSQIPGWIKDMFPQYKKLTLDRCHLIGYGDTSLKYELVFWVMDADFNVYMDLQQALLLQIYERFEKEKIQFGLPVRSIRFEEENQKFVVAHEDGARPQPQA